MRQLTAWLSFFILSVSIAWAQTPTPGAPPATDPTQTGQTGGIMDYWWVILLAIVVIAAIVYFSRSRRNTRM
jgi:heme/copper-type cytochrome/quinol oxidase subunit 2